MKTFGYTYRDKEGALKSGSLQARDRADALRQIKDMGYIPIAVTEGKAPVAGARTSWNPATWRPAVWVGAAAGVVLVAALSAWLMASKKPAKRSAPATTTAETPRRGARSALPASQTAKAVPLAAPKPVLATDPVAVTPLQINRDATVQPNSAVVSKKSPSQVSASEPGEEEQTPKRSSPYKSKTEQLLAMAMSVPPGAAMPPLPITRELDSDFADSLTNVIVIYDDDDDRTAAIKEDVAVSKNELLELVMQGRSVAEVLKEYQNTTNERAAIRNEAQRELADLLKSGKPEEAKAYLDQINKAFTDLGIEPIAMPRKKMPTPR
jgi:hypothetical protein